jgi:membrane-anchored protein YejM (alkaline phosphatase superfamily)
LLIPAYKHLFSGLLELGFKYDNISIMGKKNENDKKNFTEKAASYTFFFVIFKVIICILPEFSILPTQSYDDTSKFAHLYDFIGLLRGFALVVCLVFGIIWLFKMMKYFASS